MPEKKTTLEWGVVSDVPGEVPLTDKTIIDTGMKVDSEQQKRLKEKTIKNDGKDRTAMFLDSHWRCIKYGVAIPNQDKAEIDLHCF
jgi:hypothetical protein